MNSPLRRPPLAGFFHKSENMMSRGLRHKPTLNVVLFFLTIGTTYLRGGPWYSFGVMTILLAHEMGHYLMCKKYGIYATMPYFIPFPSFLGTMGAVIKMDARIPSRKALFDVAIAGPLAGLLLTLPAIYFGVQWSEVVEKSALHGHGTALGEPVLYKLLSNLSIGTIPQSQDIYMHPLAFAGWAGLLVTALNLLPVGQLDGGHLVYALFGRHHKTVAGWAIAGFAVVAIFIFPGYAVFLLLLLWFGFRHPPTMDETPLDNKRKAIGIITLMIFVLSFTPEPIISDFNSIVRDYLWNFLFPSGSI